MLQIPGATQRFWECFALLAYKAKHSQKASLSFNSRLAGHACSYLLIWAWAEQEHARLCMPGMLSCSCT